MNPINPRLFQRVTNFLRVALYCVFLAWTGGTIHAANTSLEMHSDVGDFVGAGANYFYTAANGSFSVTRNSSGGVSVWFNSSDNSDYWGLDFGAAAAAPLKVGIYGNATRFAFHAPNENGLEVYGDGRGSNMLTGSFEVKKIIYGNAGTIIAFWATFIQHSEGGAPALTGEIKYRVDATGVPVNQAPGVYAGVANSSAAMTPGASLLGIAGDDGLPGSLVTTWAVVSGPGTVRFARRLSLNTTATFSTPGTYILSLTANDGELSKTSQVTVNVYDPREQTSLTMASDAGDYIGQGNDYSYTLADGVFSAEKNYQGGVSVSFNSADGDHFWYLDFASPDSLPFVAGRYVNATRFAFHQPTESGLEVSGDGRGSNTLTGSFEIKKVVFGPGDTVISFWATFVQRSEGQTPALTGEIKFNADITPGDFNGDGHRDIILQNRETGANKLWLMNGSKRSTTLALGGSAGLTMVGMGDFNADGQPDLLFNNQTNGNLIVWFMNGTVRESTFKIGNVPAPWRVAGAADLNGDGGADILLENTTNGERQVWLMTGAVPTATVRIGKTLPAKRIVGSGDFDGDGKADILLQDATTGGIVIWYMDGTTCVKITAVSQIVPTLQACGAGDFDGDGKADIIFQNTTTGVREIWLMDGNTRKSIVIAGTAPVDLQIVD